MPKLPSAVDIARRPAPEQTPGISVKGIDYGPMAQEAKAVGGALQSVSGMLGSIAEARQKGEDHDIERKLLDFKLDTEMQLEEHKRNMPAGGDGYAGAWRDQFTERAKEFVGDKYANIPRRLRDQVDTTLAKHEVMLVERAQRDEFAERDRKTKDDLEVILGKTRSRVEADPGRLDSMHAEGARLIDSAALPPAMKHAYAKKYRETMEESAATSIADGVRDAESYAKAKEMLAPHKAERVTASTIKGDIKREADGMAVIASGSGAKFRVAADHAERFQGLMADLEAAGVNIDGSQSGGYANRNIAGTNKPSEHASGRAIDLNWNENARGTAGKIDPELARSLAAKHGLKWGGDWKNPDPMHFEVDSAASPRPVSQRGMTQVAGLVPPGQSEVDAYDGPFQNLPLAKRRAIFAKAETNFEKEKKGVEAVIKEQMSVAADGYLPPEKIMKELDRRVTAIGDPMLGAQYDTMLRNAQWTQRLQKAPPIAIEEQARLLRDQAMQGGTTKEGEAAIKHVETVAASVRKNVNDNPMSWANRTQIQVPMAEAPPADLEPRMRAQWKPPMANVQLEQLNFGAETIDQQLAYRAEQAKGVGRYYGQPPQMFTTNERDFLKDQVRKGGPAMLGVLGRITKAAQVSGIDPTGPMREIGKDAPELAMIGSLVAQGADGKLLDHAAKAFNLRHTEGDKFISQIDKAQSKPDLSEIMPALSKTPGMVDPSTRLANVIYEYRHRIEGKDTFDNDLYKRTLREVLGEVTENETKFGGVGRQGSGWFDGKWSHHVIVPPGVRQDSFDSLVNTMQPKDIETNPPLDGRGKPLPIADVRASTFLSVGRGRYLLKVRTASDGSDELAVDASGQPYVLDMTPMLPELQKRKPDIFRGYTAGP